jgi:hypothetical protein
MSPAFVHDMLRYSSRKGALWIVLVPNDVVRQTIVRLVLKGKGLPLGPLLVRGRPLGGLSILLKDALLKIQAMRSVSRTWPAGAGYTHPPRSTSAS